MLEQRHESALELRVTQRTARFGVRSAKLPELTFRLLRVLAARAPDIVSFADIEAEVWAAQVSRETLKQRAKLLRDALTRLGAPAHAIEAVRNEGYRLNLPTRCAEPVDQTSRRIARPLAGAFMALATIAALPVLTARQAAEPLALTIESASGAAPSEAVRRALIRDLAQLTMIRVIEAPGASGDLVLSVAMENEERLSLQLRDGRSGAVLLAEAYPAAPGAYERAVSHFANYVHEQAETLSLRETLPRESVALYASAADLARGGDEAALLLARSKLQAVLGRRPNFLVARALLARVEADLTLRYAYPGEMAQAARAEAARLVDAHPDVPEFRYALARTELAAGDAAAALNQLRIAERDLPFLRRDVQALERRLAETTT